MIGGELALAFAAGFIVEMPVGPVSSLCIRQAIVIGPIAGFVSGLVPALADSLYGALGIVGSRVPLQLFAQHRAVLQIAIGVLLCGVAIAFALSARRPPQAPAAPAAALARGMLPVVVLAFSNPGALVVAAAIFTSLGAGRYGARDYPYLAAAMFAGATGWWALVASVAARVRKRATGLLLRGMYAACALVFFAAGIASFIGVR